MFNAKTETAINLQRIRGRLFDLEIELPSGLELASVEPTELVEAVVSSAPRNREH